MPHAQHHIHKTKNRDRLQLLRLIDNVHRHFRHTLTRAVQRCLRTGPTDISVTLWRNSYAAQAAIRQGLRMMPGPAISMTRLIHTGGPVSIGQSRDGYCKHWQLINTCSDSSIQMKKLLKPSPTPVRLGKRTGARWGGRSAGGVRPSVPRFLSTEQDEAARRVIVSELRERWMD